MIKVPHMMRRGWPQPLSEQTSKPVSFYGGDSCEGFKELLAALGLRSEVFVRPYRLEVTVPNLFTFYGLKGWWDAHGVNGTVTDEWQDWIVENPALPQTE